MHTEGSIPASIAPLHTGPCWVRTWEPQEALVGVCPLKRRPAGLARPGGGCPRHMAWAEPSMKAGLAGLWGRLAWWPPHSCHSLQSTRKSENVLGDQRSRWLRISCVYNIYEMWTEQSCGWDSRPRQSNPGLCGEQDCDWGSSSLLTICKRLHTSHILSSPNLTLMNTTLSGCIISGRGRPENNF